MSEAAASSPRIEGGIDAIALGAGVEALSAAALAARRGLHTVLIDPAERAEERRAIAPGYFAQDGDPIVAALDPAVISALDLYRHGLAFAHRRLETCVRFSDGAALILPGDPRETAERVEAMSMEDARPFAALVDAARENISSALSIEEAIDGLFADQRLDDLASAEASLGRVARPGDPYSLASFAQRYVGETLGLVGALGAIAGGEPALATALRRAAQAAGVRFRQTSRARAILVEWDHVAGVEFDDGSQMRAPAIFNAAPAAHAFRTLVGVKRLNIGFAATLDRPPAAIASLRAHVALSTRFLETPAAAHLSRRLLFAPSRTELARAYAAAHSGALGDAPIVEALYCSAADPGLAGAGAVVSMLMHPSPPVISDQAAAVKVATAMLDRLAPGAGAAIEGLLLDAPAPAQDAPPILAARAARFAEAGVDGYFFCGPEAQTDRGQSGSAGRQAAELAARFVNARSR
jgi:phytoene dehydrogenase-like protein